MTMPAQGQEAGAQAAGSSTKKIVSIGNYRFTGKRLGKGNFARVDEAVHSVLNTKVAIKIMDTMTIKEEYVVRNLYREARIMAKLSHPCIVALFQTMQYGNLYYLVTELVGGGDLCGFIKNQRSGKLEERFTRIYARQLISAIAHMHNIGIVHRDLKMENIMLNAIHTQIKIVDFGLSNFYYDDNPLRTHCGSPEYAAPELFVEGKHYGPEVDLWSLGVIMYGMVVGQLPFNTVRCSTMTSQQRRKKLLEQINKGMAVVQRRAIHGFSAEFKGMMGRLLVADSAKRIKIAELIFHPWVTERGRKAIRSNPLKRLDEQTRAHLIQEVATQIQMDWIDVQQAIKYDPQCNIAGMYNILQFHQFMQSVHGDGITKTLSTETPRTPVSQRQFATPQETFSILRSPLVNDHHQSNALRSAPIQRDTKKIKNVDTNNNSNVMLPQSAGMHLRSNRIITAASGDSNKIPIASKDSSHQNAFKKLQQQNLRRKELLKSSPLPNNHTSRNASSYSRGVSTPREQISRDIVIKASAAAKKSSMEGTRRLVHSTKLPSDRKISPTKHSSESPNKRKEFPMKQHKSANEKLRPPDNRALKRKSLLPVLVPNMLPPLGRLDVSHSSHHHHQMGGTSPGCRPPPPMRVSVCSAPTKGLRNHPAFNREHSPINDKCYHATGDAVKRFASVAGSAKTTKSNFLNEPIARSIAGYVANNIPGKLQTFNKWMRNSKTGRGS